MKGYYIKPLGMLKFDIEYTEETEKNTHNFFHIEEGYKVKENYYSHEKFGLLKGLRFEQLYSTVIIERKSDSELIFHLLTAEGSYRFKGLSNLENGKISKRIPNGLAYRIPHLQYILNNLNK